MCPLMGTLPWILSPSAPTWIPCRLGGIEPYLENGVNHSRGAAVLGGDDKAGICAIADCCRRIGVPVRFGSTGGGSDADKFNIHGIRSIAAGIGMEKNRIQQRNRLHWQTCALLALELMR